MTEEQEREAFETWVRGLLLSSVPLWQNPDGTYVYWQTEWAAWQARAKLMLTLPVKDATGEH